MRHANDTAARHGGNRWVQLGKTLGGALLMHMAAVRRDRTSSQAVSEAGPISGSTALTDLARSRPPASVVPMLVAVAAMVLVVFVVRRIHDRS